MDAKLEEQLEARLRETFAELVGLNVDIAKMGLGRVNQTSTGAPVYWNKPEFKKASKKLMDAFVKYSNTMIGYELF